MVFANFTHAPAMKLLEKLGTMLPQQLRAAFFSDNGSTSVEIALKMALQYWQLMGHHHKNKIVSFFGAYHGDTAGSMSVSARGLFTDPYQKLLFDVVRFHDATTSLTDNTAALIIEPLVQGAGGMIMWDRAVLLNIIREAQKKNIIVIFDEAMTGLFRTGTRFAFDNLGITPDILCLSKGLTGGLLPLALTVCHERIHHAFRDKDPARMFFHGHTYTANPVSCASAVANLELMDASVEESVARIEAYHRARIARIASPIIKEKRMLGTIAAIELDDGDGYLAGCAPRIMALALEHGVFLRPLGNVIYVLPPYCITDEELGQVWDVIEMAIAKLSDTGFNLPAEKSMKIDDAIS
jgi:adenosylmethionine-8-amino-7-oxononanoate aminotransferase